jgi:ABC-type multidrug transport system ATPase subunit
MVLVRFENACKSYQRVHALDGVTFSVSKGEIYGCVGPNGSGKTTIVRLLLGLMSPDAGSVSVFGKAAASLSTRDRTRIGTAFESPGVYSDLTVRQNLEFYAAIYAIGPRARAVDAALADSDLKKLETRRAAQLSRGERQRLSNCRATIRDPELLILDEPTTGLDPVYRKQLRARLGARRVRGLTTFVCSNDMAELERICDRVLFLKNGQSIAVVEIGARAAGAGRARPQSLEGIFFDLMEGD